MIIFSFKACVHDTGLRQVSNFSSIFFLLGGVSSSQRMHDDASTNIKLVFSQVFRCNDLDVDVDVGTKESACQKLHLQPNKFD
jgi:hypothetical protein